VTLIEVTIVLVILGVVVQSVLKGQELIQNARVRDIMLQQAAVEQAMLAFQDRYRAWPGDYARASTTIPCSVGCLNGNGNGRVEAGTDSAIHEDILAWQHMSDAGFLRDHYLMEDASVSAPAPTNSPSSVYGGYLQVGFDQLWGYGTNPTRRHNIKTGNYVPAAVLAEIDRKIDDGLPGSGSFQFSTYAGEGAAPIGGVAAGCTAADSPTGFWLISGDNCGGATLLR
jgi:hypothetical protein